MIPPTQAPRSRNAAATRQAMLASARRHFARESYENVGLREIAGDAGVDPALVSRYFGSKEQLFKEAVRGDDEHIMHGVSRADLPAHFAALLLDGKGEDAQDADAQIDRLMILLRSASSPKASSIIREAIDEDILEPVAALLGGKDAELRASLCLSVLMGTGILRSALAVAPLSAAGSGALQRRLTSLFAAAIDEKSDAA
ncbi:TetR/AcrR family transcriptional regulator [Sphingomonas sp. DT-207]|uniref:TetR/AcrR family transcriptional regulator n=1 Tax=Sphingomonas sp. DT-207 TaxID=3396167 RepID=UPI003F1D6BAE